MAPQPVPLAYSQGAYSPYTRSKRAGVADTGIAPQANAAPAAPSYWSPAYLSTPVGGSTISKSDQRRIDRGSRGGGGGYGGGYNGMAQNFESTASLGPGAYWPGHGAEFQRDSQMAAIMPQLYQGYIGGQMQPGAMAAYLQYQNAGGTVGAARRAHGAQYGTYGQGGGGGGGGGSFADAYAAANAANENRYRDILGGHDAKYKRNMEDLKGSGAQERADINEAYTANEAARRQSLVGRGLGNSTIVDTMQMGNERERIADQGRLEERLRQQRIGLDTSLTNDTLGFMERRTDQQPNVALMAQLAQGVGAAGYGAGGVGGGGGMGYQTYSAGGGGYQMPVGYMGGGGMAGGGRRPQVFGGGLAGVGGVAGGVDRLAGDREAIAFLMDTEHVSEAEARRRVFQDKFPGLKKETRNLPFWMV